MRKELGVELAKVVSASEVMRSRSREMAGRFRNERVRREETGPAAGKRRSVRQETPRLSEKLATVSQIALGQPTETWPGSGMVMSGWKAALSLPEVELSVPGVTQSLSQLTAF